MVRMYLSRFRQIPFGIQPSNRRVLSIVGMSERTRELADSIVQPNDHSSDKSKIDRRRLALSKAITLVESRCPEQMHQADLLLKYVLQCQANDSKTQQNPSSFRIGFTGPPGAGKSTFIEAFGKYLLDQLPSR